MDAKNLEALAIFAMAFEKLEEKRKVLSKIEKKMLDDLAQCKKRIEEVKVKKRKVPFYLPCSISDMITFEESQENATKDVQRKGKRKVAEKPRNKACSKMNSKTKLRKRKSDDDLIEDQPSRKLRRDISVAKAAESEKDKSCYVEKKTLLTTSVHNEERCEKQCNNPNIIIFDDEGVVYNKTVSTQNEVSENLNEKNKPYEKIKKKNENTQRIRESSSKKVEVLDKTLSNDEELANSKTATINKNQISDDLEEKAENSVNGFIESKNTSIKKEMNSSKDKTITNAAVNKLAEQIKSSTDLIKGSNHKIELLNEENNTVKNKRVSKLNIKTIVKSNEDIGENKNEEKIKQNLDPKAIESNFRFPSNPNIIQSSSDEDSPRNKRITRSKVPKGKEKIISTSSGDNNALAEEGLQPPLRMTRSKMAKQAISNKTDKIGENIRSGEESDAMSEINSCSDGEVGKKRVKDIVKAMNERQAAVLISPVKLVKEQEKENHSSILRILHKKDKRTPSVDRKCALVTKSTPLQVRNGFITPNKKTVPLISSATRNKTVMDDAEKRRKEEEARRKRQKEEEVLRKKQELIKIKQEEIKKRHEEKMLKVAAMREAVEKEKNECFLRMEKEREEREKMAKAEYERKKMEEAIKKKMAYQTKVAEVEIRRQKEEAARLARIRELEEEQRHQEELRQKQLEENERIMKQRQEEELRAKEALRQKALLQKEYLKKQKANIIPLKDKDNYSISADLAAGDDDDDEVIDEENPKKEYPAWARKEPRLLASKVQSYYPMERILEFFGCPSSSPDLTDIFGKMTIKRIRSSSAVWLDSPPLKIYHPNKKNN